MKHILGITALGFASLTLIGCGSTTPTTPQASTPAATAAADPYPDWYYAPDAAVPDAINSASCVQIPSNNMEAARKQSIASAKTTIAGIIGTKVQAMDKTFDRITNTDAGASTGGNFESVSKQLVNQSLAGANVVKGQKVVDDGVPYFCSLLSLAPEKTEALLSSILKSSNVNLSPNNESVLREQFKAFKAEQSLDAEILKQQ